MQSTVSGLVVPDHVAVNLQRDVQVDEMIGRAQGHNRMLQGIDPRLSLVWVKEGADDPALIPGRWHLRRKNDPPAPDSYIAIVQPDGSYRDFDSGVLREMEERDLWNPLAFRRIAERQRREAVELERADELKSEQRRYELARNIKAIDSPGVRVTRDIR